MSKTEKKADISVEDVSLSILSDYPSLTDRNFSKSESQQFVQLAIEHGVTAFVYHNVQEKLNQKIRKTILENYYKSQIVRLKFIDQVAITTLKKLQNAGFEFIVLKGFAMAYSCYLEPGFRQRSDLDILVSSSQQTKIHELLVSLGFHNPRGWTPVELVKQATMRKYITKGVHLDIDIHVNISNDVRILNWLTFEEAIEDHLNVNAIAIADIPMINKYFALIHAIIHMLTHRIDGDDIKLIWLYDIHLLVEQLNNNERCKFFNVCRKKKLTKTINFGLKLTSKYFPSKQLSYFIQETNTTANSEFDFLTKYPTTKSKNILNKLLINNKNSKFLLFLKETLFPPPAEIFNKYGQVSKYLLPYYYIKRIFNGLLKLFF